MPSVAHRVRTNVLALCLASLALHVASAQTQPAPSAARPTPDAPPPAAASSPTPDAPPPAAASSPTPATPATQPVEVPEDAFPHVRPPPPQVPEDAFPPARPQGSTNGAGLQPSAAGVATAEASSSPGAGEIKGDPFAITNGNGRFRLRFALQTGIKGEITLRDGDLQDRSPFFVIRPSLSGHVVEPWIKFWFSMELANNPPFLLDGYIDLNPCDEIGLRVGQQYTPFSRHETFGPQQILFPEFSIVANYFWSGRDKGATLFGSLFDKRLDYYFGFYGGSPLRQFTILDGNYVVEGRITWSPLGVAGDTEYPYIARKGDGPAPFRPSFTLNGYYGKIRSATENFNPSTFSFVPIAGDTTTKNGTLGADVFLQSSRFVFFAEGYYRRTRPGSGFENFDTWGAWGQLGVLLIDQRLDVAVRGSWINPSARLANDRFLAIEGQFAYYVEAPYVVLKLRYGYGVQQAPNMDAQGPAVLATVTGKLHLVTLQINLSF